MEKRVYEVHEDAGHSWLKVPKDYAVDDILAAYRVWGGDEFSPFSHQDKDYVYLEEDCDAGMFLSRMKKHYDIELKWVDDGISSPIRQLPAYKYDRTSGKYIY